MKVRVKIGERTFEVEVGNLNAQPIVATVDGERFEVWVEATDEETDKRIKTIASAAPAVAPTSTPAASKTVSQPPGVNSAKAVCAPIPGVIISIAVQPGATVTVGQELCVLEAMKMKNAIRTSRAGQIAAVHVSIGQHVGHHDVIMEYED